MSILLYILHLEPKPKYFTLTQIEINSVCVWKQQSLDNGFTFQGTLECVFT